MSKEKVEDFNERTYGRDDEKLKNFFGIFGEKYSLYQTAQKLDENFLKRFKKHKEKLLEKINKCAICGKEFLDKKNIHMHHKKDWKEEVIKKRNGIIEKVKKGEITPTQARNEVKKINDNIYEDYIKFKNVILICYGCHYKEHEKSINKSV